MKVYIAAPLYSEAEKDFNLKMDGILRSWGCDTFLPQRDGGIVALMPDMIDGVPKEEYIFRKDLTEMASSDVFLFLLDGRVPDEGACVALGYCLGLGKRCIGFKTDLRSLTPGGDNLMITKALTAVAYDLPELKSLLTE